MTNQLLTLSGAIKVGLIIGWLRAVNVGEPPSFKRIPEGSLSGWKPI